MERSTIARCPAVRHETDTEALAAVEVLQRSDPEVPLSAAARRGLAHLYARYAGAMCAVGQRMVGDEALDVVHEVFLELPQLLGQYRGNGLWPWLRRIVVTRCLMRLRRRKRFVEGDIPKDVACGADHVGRVELDGFVREALGRLPASLREVVVMKYFLSMSHQEIAALLEITPTASELRLFRAVKRMKMVLGSHRGGLRSAA